MYELRIKKAANQYGGGDTIGLIYFNGKYLAVIGASTQDEIEAVYEKFLKGR